MAQKHEIIWAKTAHADLVEIIQRIRADNPMAAATILKSIKEATAVLTLFPQQGRIVPELKQQGIVHYRELIVAPWRVIYRIAGSSIYVLSVIDARRNVEDVLLDRLVRNV